MLRNYSTLLRYMLFWYIVLVVARICFITLNWHLASEFDVLQLLFSFLYGFRLDLSVICYLTVLPLFFWYSSHFFSDKTVINRILKTSTVIVLIAVILISTIDAELYRFWGQKLNAYASSFAKFPKDMLTFSSGTSSFKLAVVIVIQTAIAYFLYSRGMRGLDEVNDKVNKWIVTFVFILSAGLLFLGIRGGVGRSTINPSFAYHSSNPFLNHTALNTSWNFLATLIKADQTTHNPYKLLPENDARQIVTNLYQTDSLIRNSQGLQLLNTPRPNIVLIILEGWTADVIESLGGDKNVTPHFNKLCEDGYLFTNFYASGNRTDKGLAAIISSQPAMATKSIINNIEKFTSLPSLAASLQQNGYNTSFVYGGQSEFANMKAYWMSSGYQYIYDLNVFPQSLHNARWGVHDDVLFEKSIELINNYTQPFFTSILTLSSHEPFKVPVQSNFRGNDESQMYRNAAHFSDAALGSFFQTARRQSWYANTLFIILSDHGHRWPYNREPYEPAMFHIPFLITGGALKDEWRGQQNNKISSQTDIAPSILKQLNLPYQSFIWGKDLFMSQPEFATYTFNDGIGFISPQGKIVFDQESKQTIINRTPGDTTRYRLEQKAKAYQQVYFDEYLKR